MTKGEELAAQIAKLIDNALALAPLYEAIKAKGDYNFPSPIVNPERTNEAVLIFADGHTQRTTKGISPDFQDQILEALNAPSLAQEIIQTDGWILKIPVYIGGSMYITGTCPQHGDAGLLIREGKVSRWVIFNEREWTKPVLDGVFKGERTPVPEEETLTDLILRTGCKYFAEPVGNVIGVGVSHGCADLIIDYGVQPETKVFVESDWAESTKEAIRAAIQAPVLKYRTETWPLPPGLVVHNNCRYMPAFMANGLSPVTPIESQYLMSISEAEAAIAFLDRGNTEWRIIEFR